ncbi:MAG: GNAT family N-acetyltransferase [Planctomycetes bacterium]|nr:GNAT family N-acetyltransferase [Planctomycetota bacterium]
MSLRAVSESDLSVFFEHQREPEANRMAAFPPRELDAFMTHWKERILASDRVIKRTICVDEVVVGNALCFEEPAEQGQPARWLIGYWIGQRFWGRGIASQAVGEFVAGISKRPLFAFVARENAGSQRVLEKCGFELIEKIAAKSDNQDSVDECLYRLA